MVCHGCRWCETHTVPQGLTVASCCTTLKKRLHSLFIYFLPQKSIDVSSLTTPWRCKHSHNTSAANQTPETCCRWVKQCARLALLLAVAGFVLVIPEQMMCLRPYGRPLGLLCAVTDVAHVNFKGFLLHFKNPPPPLLLLICRMNGESAPC